MNEFTRFFPRKQVVTTIIFSVCIKTTFPRLRIRYFQRDPLLPSKQGGLHTLAIWSTPIGRLPPFCLFFVQPLQGGFTHIGHLEYSDWPALLLEWSI